MTLTYGELPKLEDFEAMWEGDVGPERGFEVRNCKRVGNRTFRTARELYSELELAVEEWGGETPYDAAGDWASAILSVFGVEWV
jgi:hypothetical protein